MKTTNCQRSLFRTVLIAATFALCALSATVPAIASPSCDGVFPIAVIQSAYPGATVNAVPIRAVGGALLMNCAYRVSGSGTVSLKLFDASQESSYSTTVSQLGKEGYKCQPIDSTVGFPASGCALAAGSITINIIVFTTSNGKYAAMITGGLPLAPLYAMAKSVNSNISSH
jgi:hypothetical protein